MNEEIINPADSLANNDTIDESVLDSDSSVNNDSLNNDSDSVNNGEASTLLKFSKKIRATSQVFLDYNAILDYIVKNYKNWDKNAQGCFVLKRNKHTLSFDGKNIPQIDDKYFLSDVLVDKLPKSLTNWVRGLK